MDIVAHRPRAVRDQIVDREVRRLELIQRAKRDAIGTRPHPEPPAARPEPR